MSAETTPAELTYTVPGISCGHCEVAISDEVARVLGVTAVQVDLDSKRVSVRGARLDDASLREAIGEAGYDAEP
jgi:copper chaperone CopZ